MKPEPPLGIFPARPDVWYAGVDACQRGLPITFDHPYCCTLKDVWEAGWKAAAGERPVEAMAPADHAYWHSVGQNDHDRCHPLVNIPLREPQLTAYMAGHHEAERRAKASKDATPTTLQQLIDAWKNAHKALTSRINEELPYGCRVQVDHPRYKGTGLMKGISAELCDTVAIKIENENIWHYPATSVRRIP